MGNRIDTVYILYCMAVIGVTFAHLGWLLYEQTEFLEQYGEDTTQAYVQALPTWIPIGVTLLITLPFSCIFCICKCAEKDKGEDSTGMTHHILFINFLFCLLSYIPFYTVQIVVYLWIDVQMYLDKLPRTALCFCSPHVTTFLSSPVYQCQCKVPYQNEKQTVYVNKPEDFNSSRNLWSDYGLEYNGTTVVRIVNTTEEASEEADVWSYNETKKMFIYLQLCLVLIVIRFPVWIIIQSWSIMEELRTKSNEKPEEPKKPNGATGRGGHHNVLARTDHAKTKEGAPHVRGQCTGAGNHHNTRAEYLNRAKEEQRTVREYAKEQFLKASGDAIETCFYGFVEGADALSFLDEIMNESSYFADNENLTLAMLLFISLTIVIPSITNIALMIDHKRSEKVKFQTKLGVAIVSNIPFFVIRMYLFSLYGDRPDGSKNTVFLLFAIKELVTVLLVVVEIALETQVVTKYMGIAFERAQSNSIKKSLHGDREP